MESKDLLDKLERIERSLHIYEIKTENLVQDIPIDIPLERLKIIVTPKKDDLLLYMGYHLDAKQLRELNNDLGGIINPDFNSFYYVLDCTGIYNW